MELSIDYSLQKGQFGLLEQYIFADWYTYAVYVGLSYWVVIIRRGL